MAQEKWTDEELASLTEEERAGLLDETLRDDDAEEDENADDGKGGTDDGADDPEGDGGKEPSGDEPADNGDDGDPPAEPDDGKEPSPKAEDKTSEAEADEPPVETPRRRSDPLPNYQSPEDADAQIKTLRQEQRDLAAKFDEGELNAADYHDQRASLDDKIADLREIRLKASMSVEARKHTYVNDVVPDWLSRHGEYVPGKPRYNALNLELIQLQQAAEAEGKDPLDPALLDQAHAIVEGDFGGAAPKQQTPPPREKRDLPPSLSDVPASDMADDLTDRGKYAYLDRLTGVAFEEALAKLPETEREAYLAAAT